MDIIYDLLPRQKARKQNLKVKIDLFLYATELYEELDRIGIINRIMEIPQLGVIKISKKLSKTRYDYIMLQMYLHQLIKKDLQGQLKISYNNSVAASEFRDDYQYLAERKPTICDILQILTIIYNIGHFYNTFTASQAITMLASKDQTFYDKIVYASESKRYQKTAQTILNDTNYLRFHLLNAILILERCDKTKPSVSLALEIIYSYLNESMLSEESKLKYVFHVFKVVRKVSFIAYDLQIAEMPLIIDVCDKKGMLILLQELLSEHNNNQSSLNLVDSIAKLLGDTVYNESSSSICYYRIARKMVSMIMGDPGYLHKNYYTDWFSDKNSILNSIHTHKRDYLQTYILKLTFPKERRSLSMALLADLERINNTRVGYYDRHSGEQTIMVSIRKNCDSDTKRITAFKSMRCALRFLRRIPNISSTDERFILCAKFFLFYLFDENPVVIKPTIDREKCVICTRGNNSRKTELMLLLNNSTGNDDVNHEVEFMLSQLNTDPKNDISITIPASIVVYQKDNIGLMLCEFDGMIIHPMRKSDQILFLEAKNRDKQPIYGKNCLRDKLKKLSFVYSYDDIQVVDCDAYYKFTV